MHAVVSIHVLAPYLRKTQLHRSLSRLQNVFTHLCRLLRLFKFVEGETLLVCAPLQHFQLVAHESGSCVRLFRGRTILFAQLALVVVLHLVEDDVFRLFYVYLIA